MAASAALLAVNFVRAHGPSAQYVTSVPLPYAGPGVGGWSGVDVSADGAYFWAVTDRGKRSEGQLLRAPDETLEGIEARAPVFLPGLIGPRIGEYPDAEGIDVGPAEWRTYVSFEGFERLRSYDRAWHRAGWVPEIPKTRRYHDNKSFEALARDDEGRLYTLPERPVPPDEPYPLYRYTETPRETESHWSIAARVTHDKGWLATGADFGPDGMLYLLERRFGGVGFSSRIRKIDLSDTGPTDAVSGTVIYRSALGTHGNLEGIGIWKDRAGRLRATMVSDDNQRRFQRAEMVEVILDAETGLAQ